MTLTSLRGIIKDARLVLLARDKLEPPYHQVT
jgi:hypothetical protein